MPARPPTTPPPSTSSDAGIASAVVASRLVHGCASRSPAIGGSAARLPGASTIARRAREQLARRRAAAARPPARRDRAPARCRDLRPTAACAPSSRSWTDLVASQQHSGHVQRAGHGLGRAGRRGASRPAPGPGAAAPWRACTRRTSIRRRSAPARPARPTDRLRPAARRTPPRRARRRARSRRTARISVTICRPPFLHRSARRFARRRPHCSTIALAAGRRKGRPARRRELALASAIMDESLAGQLLLASPSLRDPNFERTVVLIGVHSAEGAMGVVLNRPSELTVAEAAPQLEDAVARQRARVRRRPRAAKLDRVPRRVPRPRAGRAAGARTDRLPRARCRDRRAARRRPSARACSPASPAGARASSRRRSRRATGSRSRDAGRRLHRARPSELWSDVLTRKGGSYALRRAHAGRPKRQLRRATVKTIEVVSAAVPWATTADPAPSALPAPSIPGGPACSSSPAGRQATASTS